MNKKTHIIAVAAIIAASALFALASNLADARASDGVDHIAAFETLCTDARRMSSASDTLLDRCERWTVSHAS
ncbi:hypothetical protein [Mesorhizobium sp. A623]